MNIELQLPSLLIFALAVLLHELGHYFTAKKQGLYEGWGLTLPEEWRKPISRLKWYYRVPLRLLLIIVPHIKLSEPFKHRSSYLWGYICSLAVLPLVWLIGGGIFEMFAILTLIAIVDILVFLYYNRIIKKGDVK